MQDEVNRRADLAAPSAQYRAHRNDDGSFSIADDAGWLEGSYVHAPSAPAEVEGLALCDGCGCTTTDAELADMRGERSSLISCCPERKMRTAARDDWDKQRTALTAQQAENEHWKRSYEIENAVCRKQQDQIDELQATIARLTAERDVARARITVMVHPQARDPDGAVALDAHVKRAVDAETRACAATVANLRDEDNQIDEAIARDAILARLDQSKAESV